MNLIKNFFILLLMLVINNFAFSKSNKVIVDKIIARVNGANILKSDLNKKRINKNGECYSLQEAIMEEILIQKATEMKMVPTETDVEKQIVALKIHNKLADLSDEEFEEQLKTDGFTLSEYKLQLARMLAISKLNSAEFSERIVVTNQQVEEYCKAHPEWVDDSYLIKICELNKDMLTEESGIKPDAQLKWEDIGWIQKKDLSKELDFMRDMKIGETSKLIKTDAGYKVFKLADKKEGHQKTLDERYIEIERLLQDQKKEKFEKEYEQELLGKATIVYLD